MRRGKHGHPSLALVRRPLHCLPSQPFTVSSYFALLPRLGGLERGEQGALGMGTAGSVWPHLNKPRKPAAPLERTVPGPTVLTAGPASQGNRESPLSLLGEEQER